MSEIEIRVVSRDDSGPGVDSATRRVDRLGQSTVKAGQAVEEADKRTKGWSASMRRIGETAAGFLVADTIQMGARKAIALMQSTVHAASSLGESVNAVQKTFEGASGVIEKFGKTSAEAVGLSERAFNEAATPLGAILKNQGLSLKDTADETIKLTQRAADLASVFNTDVRDALGAVSAGLRGETEPLRRYGITINEVQIQQKALAATGKTSAAQLTLQEKAVARLSLIYDQSASSAGDFQDTVDGLANSQRVSQARIEDAQAKIGTAYLPIMAKAAQITGQLASVFSTLPGYVQTAIAALAAAGAAAVIAAPRMLAVNVALKTMAANGSLAAKSLALVTSGLMKFGGTVVVLAFLREMLDQFGVLNQTLGAVPGIGDSLVEAYGNVSTSLKEAKKDTTVAAVAQHALTTAMEDQIDAGEDLVTVWDKIHGAQKSADETMLAAKEAIQGVGEAFKENGSKLSGNSTAALENRIAMEDAARAAAAAAQKYLDQTGDVEGAKKMMDNFRIATEKSTHTTGTAAKRVHDLAVELFKLPEFKEITVKANIQVLGAGQLHRALTDVDRLGGFASGGISGAAAGGQHGGMRWVGEQGPELVRLPFGSTVYPTGQSKNMAAATGGGGEVRVVLDIRGGDDDMKKLIRKWVRLDGAGDVQLAFGR